MLSTSEIMASDNSTIIVYIIYNLSIGW